jgi:hypothetical protein
MLCLLGPLAGHAQGQDEGPNLRITAVGGYLGYRDGLTEAGITRGGLVAFEQWFAGQIKSGHILRDDLLLVTGNNMPLQTGSGLFTDPAWSSILSARPTAIALSVDDFRRMLGPTDGVKNLIQGLESATGIPLVASNAIIRARKDGLNVVESEGFELEISANESIAWNAKIPVAGGDCRAVARTLTDRGAPAAAVPGMTCDDTTDGHFTLTFTPSLRPGRTYELELTSNDRTRKTARFRFLTHGALITLPDRVDGVAMPPELQGLPVRAATRNFNGQQTSVVIVAMVDPDLKKGLGADRWKWKPAAAACAGTECEIDFLPATDAFKAIVGLASEATTDAPPVFIMMSGLKDRQTMPLMSTLKDQVSATVPVVLLDPDSSVLGQDLGFESIVNGGKSQQGTTDTDLNTQLWVRPPWTGRRAAIIRAHLSLSKRRWRVASPYAFAEPIAADPLTTTQTGNLVSHSIPGATLGSFPAYAQYTGAALSSDHVWNGLAALFLDVMRRDADADLAMLPKHFIDAEIVAWLAEETKKAKPLSFSSFILQKSIYQTENIVTVAIEGSKLAATLAAIVKTEKTDGEDVFVAGIGATGAQSQIDTKHLLVNERAIVSDRFYKVALPQSLAETNSLTVASDDALPSLFDAVDNHLRNRDATLLRPQADIGKPEKAFAGRKQLYLTLNPAKFAYFRATPNNPVALKAVPLAGRAVKEERQWAISGKGDFGWDAPRWAVRATGDLKFAKDTLSTPPTYPEDEWTSGGRFDVKFHAGNVRLFTGGFKQSQFRYRQDAPITPTRPLSDIVVQATGEAVAAATTKGATVTPRTQEPDNPDRPAYVFWRSGLEVLSWNPKSWLAVKSSSAAFDVGKAYNERTHVVLDGLEPFDIGDVYKVGMEAFLNDLFARNPAAFSAPQELDFNHSSHPQNRLQLDATLEVKGQSTWPRLLSGMTWTNTAQVRRYFNEDDRPTFTANWSADLKSTVDWTVINRLKLGPYVNYYRVGVSLPEDVALGRLDYLKIGIEINIPLFISFRPASVFQ